MKTTLLIIAQVESDETAAGDFDDSACVILEQGLSAYQGVESVRVEAIQARRCVCES